MEVSLAAVLPQIFTGLVLGMIFVLLAIGLSLIFGLMTVVNFAHGALYMLGAYCTVFLLGFTRNFWVALLVAPLMVGTFGLLVVGIGCALAGLAGALAGPMRGAYAEMGVTMVIESFVVVVVGGMGSLLGAVVAGIMMGQVVGITTFFAPKLAEIMVFVVMALVLLVRPSGFFGEAGLME